MANGMLRIADESKRRTPRKMAFTVDRLEAIPSPARGMMWVYDEKVTGLAILITANDARTYYLYKKVNGTPVRLRLGGYKDLKIDQARALAKDKLHDIANGRNPHAERKVAREGTTLEELWNHYFEHRASKKRSKGEDKGLWDTHLAAWQAKRLTDIDRPAVVRLHSKLGAEHPYRANRMLALLSVMFSHAQTAMGFTGTNPAKGVKRFHETARERFLQADELARFFAALEADDDADIRDFFKTLLLTGQRRTNVQRMQWSMVNLQSATWTMPGEETKNGKAMTVYLSAAVLEILTARKKGMEDAVEKNPAAAEWVFPGRPVGRHATIAREVGPLQEPKKAWKRILARAKITGLRMHDLRRTMGSWQAATGASLQVIGKTLGHLNQSTTAVYARLNMDPVRAAVDAATAAMMLAGKDAVAKQ